MAQLVARLVRNEKVGGSNPPSSTKEVEFETCPASMRGSFVSGVMWSGMLARRTSHVLE